MAPLESACPANSPGCPIYPSSATCPELPRCHPCRSTRSIATAELYAIQLNPTRRIGTWTIRTGTAYTEHRDLHNTLLMNRFRGARRGSSWQNRLVSGDFYTEHRTCRPFCSVQGHPAPEVGAFRCSSREFLLETSIRGEDPFPQILPLYTEHRLQALKLIVLHGTSKAFAVQPLLPTQNIEAQEILCHPMLHDVRALRFPVPSIRSFGYLDVKQRVPHSTHAAPERRSTRNIE